MLTVTNLTIENSHHCLLKSASFTLSRGECVAIIGASGSGKSILANALLSSLPAGFKQSGELSFTDPEQASMAIVAQGATALNPSATVHNQLKQKANKSWKLANLFQTTDKATTRQTINDVVVQSKLSADILPLYPYQLSGGMAKRTLAAMALIQDTDFVIADEPTCGLETAKSEALFAELAQLRQHTETSREKGVLIISHDLPGVIKHVDRILVLKEGRIVDNTTPDAIQNGQAHEYTMALWQASPQHWVRKQDAKAG